MRRCRAVRRALCEPGLRDGRKTGGKRHLRDRPYNRVTKSHRGEKKKKRAISMPKPLIPAGFGEVANGMERSLVGSRLTDHVSHMDMLVVSRGFGKLLAPTEFGSNLLLKHRKRSLTFLPQLPAPHNFRMCKCSGIPTLLA